MGENSQSEDQRIRGDELRRIRGKDAGLITLGQRSDSCLGRIRATDDPVRLAAPDRCDYTVIT